MNTYLKYQPAAIQFFSFLAFAAFFIWINSIVSTTFFSQVTAEVFNKTAHPPAAIIEKFKWMQLFSSLTTFVLPALLFAYFSSPEPLRYVGLHGRVLPLVLLATVSLLVCTQPFISYVGYLNSKINFGSMQQALQEIEDMNNRLFSYFLEMRSAGDLLKNLLIMAVVPAIGEELFFRGCLQKVLGRLSRSPLVAIVISSLVFALLHGTFMKILPIFCLGVILGTIYYFTRNLWYNMLLHFVNNSIIVFGYYYASNNPTVKKLVVDDFTFPVYVAGISLLATISIIYLIKKKCEHQIPPILSSENNDYIA